MLRPDYLRKLNELQHRIAQTHLRVINGNSDADFEASIFEGLIGDGDAEFRGLTTWAWLRAKDQTQIQETQSL